MLALNHDARRLAIRASGWLERRLKELAKAAAEDQGASEVSADHVRLAIRKIAGDNSTLLQCLHADEGDHHVERCAG